MSDLSRVELVPPNPDLNASYNSCVGVYDDQSWCATGETANYDHDSKWGYCDCTAGEA